MGRSGARGPDGLQRRDEDLGATRPVRGVVAHDHGKVTFAGSATSQPTLTALRALHPALADNLILAARYAELGDDERRLLLETQRAVEAFAGFALGYYAASDRCAGCAMPILDPLFVDRYDGAELPYGAFIDDVPLHARKECLDAFVQKHPRRPPQLLDKLRREHTLDRQRPSAHMALFFRADAMKHGAFGLEDWANSVAAANEGKLDKTTARDIERLLHWVHGKLFH